MSDYKPYKCEIKLNSNVETPFEADIIWGHMIWALKYLYGKDKVDEILENKDPYLILSDAFPSGSLPVPLSGIPLENIKGIMRQYSEKGLSSGMILKLLNFISRRPFMSLKHIINILKNPSELTELWKKSLKCDICPLFLIPVKKIKKQLEGINNLPGKICKSDKCFCLTGDFSHECRIVSEALLDCGYNHYYYTHKKRKNEKWDIYFLSSMNKETILNVLNFIGHNGYGRNASRGSGSFIIECFYELSGSERFDMYSGQENGFMTLSSSYMPLAGEIEDIESSRYKLISKIGRLGGHWASLKNSHKYPVVMARAGSVFFETPGVRKFYGQIVENVHSELKEVVQYGFAFPLWGNFFSPEEF